MFSLLVSLLSNVMEDISMFYASYISNFKKLDIYNFSMKFNRFREKETFESKYDGTEMS